MEQFQMEDKFCVFYVTWELPGHSLHFWELNSQAAGVSTNRETTSFAKALKSVHSWANLLGLV